MEYWINIASGTVVICVYIFLWAWGNEYRIKYKIQKQRNEDLRTAYAMQMHRVTSATVDEIRSLSTLLDAP